MMDAFAYRTQTLHDIVQRCADLGVRNFIISPGSRSAPLTTALARHPHIHSRIIVDERSAAYTGMGIAQQTRVPVGLVCTSGTAALNYAPAVVEAHYQRIPLLVFTADRPPEWIDQQDNQSIHQQNLYEPHVRGSFQLPVDMSHADARWYSMRLMGEAIALAQGTPPGPVHINVPLREPLYGELAAQTEAAPRRTMRAIRGQLTLGAAQLHALGNTWRRAARKLIVVGSYPPDAALRQALYELRHLDLAIIGDVTSNLYPDVVTSRYGDALFGTRTPELQEALAPDLLVTIGGPLVSKYLKLFLRSHRPKVHWHVDPAGTVVDTYQALTEIVVAEPARFLSDLALRSSPQRHGSFYASTWLANDPPLHMAIRHFLSAAPFGEFQAVDRVLAALPANSHLQIGNSMVIRYVNFIAHVPEGTTVHSNRGTSGIDGTVSTAVGAALATDVLTTLLVGDLGFFYDRNALWNSHVPPNLRIVIFNNHGGGIFNLISGPEKLAAELRHEYFFTPQPLTARRTAQDHGLDYVHCDSAAGLDEALSEFFTVQNRAAILEIETDADINARVFSEFKKILA